jgi:lipid-A-disaccharide synthase
MSESKSVLVIAGEVSGDMHAAQVVRAMQEKDPALTFWGIGGEQLEACGMELLYHVNEMAVVGITEVLKRYLFFREVFGEMQAACDERKPDLVLLVDYPGFNLRFAKKVHGTGPKVAFYICPQVWAWKQSRIKTMAQCLDRLMVIFPFEVALFDGYDLPVDYVGHPLVEKTELALQAPLIDLPWGEGTERVALLPGSRAQEIDRILPVLLDSATLIEIAEPGASFIIAAANPRIEKRIADLVDAHPRKPQELEIVTANTRQVVRQARAALVASGTATLETALLECPMVIVYKTAALTWFIGKRLVKIPHIGMVNVMAKKEVCPEFLQDAAQAPAISAALIPLLSDSPKYREMNARLQHIRNQLHLPGDENVAATLLLEDLG